jgi:predicted Zn-dependent protease
MTRQATRSQIVNLAGVPVGVILGGGIGGAVVRQGANVGIPAAFMHLTRQDEAEADYLGVQYLYAAGYDPNGAISIFEKLESLERKQPGTVARIFSTHPMDAARIRKTEQEIESILPARDEYVINTSEYIDIRQRMISLEARKKAAEDGRPQLRTRQDAVEQPGDPDRPTVRRRDLVE